jgi:haloalkane dehalogenase
VPGVKPYGRTQFKELNGKKLAYIDEGQGDAIVFQHGNPTWSYLWRNIMPHLEGMGRLVACDLIGLGGSEKLDNPGSGSYHYNESRDYLFALWDALDLGENITLVLHDWGGPLGFEWAKKNRDRIAGIAYMEAPVVPLEWEDFPEEIVPMLQACRSPEGEEMILQHNMFIEGVIPGGTLRRLSDEEMDLYRQPFRNPGEDRRPTLSWPRNIPIAGEPAGVVSTVQELGDWLSKGEIPKLLVRGEPGFIIRGRPLEAVRAWPNQHEVAVPGLHFIQEDSPDQIGAAVASFVRTIRQSTQDDS